MDEVTLKLLPQEAVDIINILGQLPTQSNAFPLFAKLKAQFEEQVKPVSVNDQAEKAGGTD
jgi:hypothetical protein